MLMMIALRAEEALRFLEGLVEEIERYKIVIILSGEFLLTIMNILLLGFDIGMIAVLIPGMYINNVTVKHI